jgi:hypothetical protein
MPLPCRGWPGGMPDRSAVRPCNRCGGLGKNMKMISFVMMDTEKVKKYVKRLGFAGFMFFLIKGLIWLAIFFGGAKLLDRFF